MEAVNNTQRAEFPPELAVRKEVREFVRAAERLLSPVLIGSDLTEEERSLIREYVMPLSHAKHPWSKELPVKYT